MANKEETNKRCIEYIEQIEKRIHELTGQVFTPMPRNHKDNDILRMQQLHNIASWLDRIPDSQVDNDDVLDQARELVSSAQWSKPQLKTLLIGRDDGTPDD